MNGRKRLITGVSLVLLLLVAGIGWAMESGRYSDLGQMPLIVTIVKNEYVEPPDTLELLKAYVKAGNINGMLKALGDPYTYYMDPATYEEMHATTSGSYEGIGVIIGLRDDKIIVVAPFEGTPGDKAGLKPEDRIVAIDGKSVEGMTLQQAVNLIKGPKGTEVVITIERGEEGIRKDFRIVRDDIKIPSVDSKLIEEGIGYIRLITFSEDTDIELDKAVHALRQKGAKGMILDLRMNPGGLLSTALRITDKFLKDGPILHVVSRNGKKQTFMASPWKSIDEPVVVLVDRGSASASEILAGALQDAGRAILVGTRTFGKGKVQSVIPLRDGSALSVTVAKYLTAGGRDINEKGIEPDIIVEFPEVSTDKGEKGTNTTDDQKESGKDGVTSGEERGNDAGEGEEEEPVKDIQLLKAIEVLKQVMKGEMNAAGGLTLKRAG